MQYLLCDNCIFLWFIVELTGFEMFKNSFIAFSSVVEIFQKN